MSPRARKRNELAQTAMPLLLLGVTLVSSNRYFTILNEEAWTLDAATQPIQATLTWVHAVSAQPDHAPLYDFLLRSWLIVTGGAFEYLRVPSILFFLAGLFLLSRAAHRLGSSASGVAVIWLGALWPLGFHYDRLAAWNSFLFFLIAGLTHAYFRYIENQSFNRWSVLFLFGLGLLWSSYLGWVLLVFLMIDQGLRLRRGEPAASVAVLTRTGALFCVAFIPAFNGLRGELAAGLRLYRGASAVVSNAAFSLYTLLVSESVAPWYWRLSIPAGLAVLICLGLVLAVLPRPVRRFLVYGLVVFALMAVTGVLTVARLFLVGPWFLLPIGVAVSTNASPWMRRTLAMSLILIGGIGWYGIYSRHFYSELSFVEPWLQTAGDAADKIQNGAAVISNSPSFFFYLTYILRVPDSGANWKFVGVLPDSVHHPRVDSPERWMASGRAKSPAMIWVQGLGAFGPEKSMNDAAAELDHTCGGRVSRFMMRDAGYAWKQRFLPSLDESPWRIEIREYDCTATARPPLPAR